VVTGDPATVPETTEDAGPSARRSVVRWAAWLAITGVSLYLVAPSIIQVVSSSERLRDIKPLWLVAMLLLQVASLACLWALQRMAMHHHEWFSVITSQLAGNAFARVVPGGGAAGAALQYRMLVNAGVPGGEAAIGLTASSLLVYAVLLALPVLALPTLVGGGARGLAATAWVGFAIFAALFALGIALLAFNKPLCRLGDAIQGTRNRLGSAGRRLEGLPDRLLVERDRILRVLGRQWWEALLATVGRWAFDYATLLTALAAVGAHPSPPLVLLAFCTASLLTLVPVTPGGLGFVEAGLTATLALAGVSPGRAVLATLAYRLVSYWLPLPAGLAGAILHRRRYGGRPEAA
jgi:putative heme transporter